MSVRQGSDDVEHGCGQFAEDHFAVTIEWLLPRGELILPQIIPVIVDRMFLRVPSGLELSETIVTYIGPAETEALETALRQTLDRFPHDEVVCTNLLILDGRCSVFVKGLPAEVEKDCAGDRFAPV